MLRYPSGLYEGLASGGTAITNIARRRWFQFSLSTLFVLVTVLAVFLAWLAYNLNWIAQRKEGLKWLSMHRVTGTMSYTSEPRPDLPWSLKVLGQSPIRLHCISAHPEELDDLPAFRASVAAIAKVLPERHIFDNAIVSSGNIEADITSPK
jgi:hypothetical protein